MDVSIKEIRPTVARSVEENLGGSNVSASRKEHLIDDLTSVVEKFAFRCVAFGAGIAVSSDVTDGFRDYVRFRAEEPDGLTPEQAFLREREYFAS